MTNIEKAARDYRSVAMQKLEVQCLLAASFEAGARWALRKAREAAGRATLDPVRDIRQHVDDAIRAVGE